MNIFLWNVFDIENMSDEFCGDFDEVVMEEGILFFIIK